MLPGVGRIGSHSPNKGVGATPVTTNFDSATVRKGLGGPVDPTTNAARRYMRASCTVWNGRIRGTDAVLAIDNNGGTNTNNVEVSVDGGAFANKNRSSGLVTLFSGLTDAWHEVRWRVGSAFGASAYVLASGNILSVTGVAPAIETPEAWVQVGLTGDFTAAELSAHPTNFVPTQGMVTAGNTNGASIGSLAFQGAPTKLFFGTKATHVAVSVDGASPAFYATGNTGGVIVSCDGASHSYFTWDAGFGNALGAPHIFSVGAIEALSDLASEKRIHAFGHSIVYGQAATSPAHTDMGASAARKGYWWQNLGVTGDTIQKLKDRIDTILALMTVTSSDVAIIDIGRNEATGAAALDATAQTNLTYIIDACQAKGYGKILVLGQIIGASWNPYTGGQFASMQSVVAAQSDANVIAVDRSTYKTTAAGGTIATSDGTHPTDAGYVTMNTLNITTLDPLIP